MPSAGLGGAGPRVRSSVGPCFGLGQHLDTGRPGLPAGGAGGAGLGRRRETNQSGPSRPRLRHDDHCMIFTAMMIVATVAGFQSRSRPACNPLTFPIQSVKLRVKRKVVLSDSVFLGSIRLYTRLLRLRVLSMSSRRPSGSRRGKSHLINF